MVDLNYNFECDWLVELSDNKVSNNKLSDNNLTGELVGKKEFFKPITNEEIVIFMINIYKFLRTLQFIEMFHIFNLPTALLTTPINCVFTGKRRFGLIVTMIAYINFLTMVHYLISARAKRGKNTRMRETRR